jgi:short-subunit dehydrogenase
MRIKDSVALVTGASSGIGAAAANRLAARGARVILHGRDEARLAELADRLDADHLVADLADGAAVDRLAAAALDVAGRIDVLVHNAGIGWAGRFDAMPEATAAHLVAVNLVAPIRLTRLILPSMLAARRGQVVFVTSIAGRTAVAGEAVYAATKAGLDIFAESLAFELSGTEVRVGVFVPGVVDTPFFARRGMPYRRTRPRPQPVEQVAEGLVEMIASGRPERYAPRWLRLPVAIRATAPGVYRRLAARFGQAPTGHPQLDGRTAATASRDRASLSGRATPADGDDRRGHSVPSAGG